MTRIIIEKSGIRTDVPENEVTHYLRLGYVRVGTLPDTLPEKDRVPTSLQAAVADAAENLARAEKDLSDAEIALDLAQQATTVTVTPEPEPYGETWGDEASTEPKAVKRATK